VSDPQPVDLAQFPEVTCAIEAPEWDDVQGLEAIAARACAAAFHAAGVAPEGRAVSILFASDAEIADLNRDHRGKAGPTNVLSWPAHDLAPEAPGDAPPAPPAPRLMPGETAEEIGDLALAHGVCATEARARGIALSAHLTHLILHGTLHCLGYDHISDTDADMMEGLERDAMRAMGLHDPYEDPGVAGTQAPPSMEGTNAD
jgi:probable rRNA maturation factor